MVPTEQTETEKRQKSGLHHSSADSFYAHMHTSTHMHNHSVAWLTHFAFKTAFVTPQSLKFQFADTIYLVCEGLQAPPERQTGPFSHNTDCAATPRCNPFTNTTHQAHPTYCTCTTWRQMLSPVGCFALQTPSETYIIITTYTWTVSAILWINCSLTRTPKYIYIHTGILTMEEVTEKQPPSPPTDQQTPTRHGVALQPSSLFIPEEDF